MDKRNDIYKAGNDSSREKIFAEPYSDGIFHIVENKYRLNRRIFNKTQAEWKDTENGVLQSPDYATVRLSEETIFRFGKDWDELVEKTDGWLFSVDYDSYDYNMAFEYDKDIYFPNGGCSSIQKGSIRGRNYDWYIDWSPTFLVRTKGGNGRYATIGFTTGRDTLMRDIALSKKYVPYYDILPFRMLDGINEKGLMVNINVCQILNNEGELEITNMKDKDEPAIPMIMFTRYALDFCANVDEVIDLVSKRNFYGADRDGFTEEFHFMVSDSTGRTIVVEWKDNEPRITEANVMTNYKLCEDPSRDYGAGHERSEILSNGLAEVETAEDAFELMKKVHYTNCYKNWDISRDIFWYSELNGKGEYPVLGAYDLHQGVDHSEYVRFAEVMVKLFRGKDKDTELRKNANTWQTVHTSVYDPENNRILINVQEQEQEPLEIEIKF